MLLTPESIQEFNAARRRAFIEEWLSAFSGRSNDLLSFEHVKETLNLQDSSYKGLQEIELDKIIGSIGRYRDFTRTFLPKTDTTQERWRRVDAVAHEQGFPPIEVYKVGDVYFVRDGNHRVSVARAHKAKTIEAYVIEYKTPVPITKEDNLDDILLKLEHAKFLEETQLDQIRPGQNIVFTEPGRYRLVQEHIAFHKYLKETECGCEISDWDAVGSWYDTVYKPVVHLIHEQNILPSFPGRTEADLYAWLLLHRAELESEMEALGYISNEEVIEGVKAENSANPLTRLFSYFQYRLSAQDMPLRVAKAKFLDETHLDETHPTHNLNFTQPDYYRQAREHIEVHKYLRETAESRSMSFEEAAASWYDHVYLPVIQLIRERGALKYFPNQIDGDLYIRLVARRAALEQEQHTLGQVPTEKILDELETEVSSNAFARLINYIREKLDL